MKATWSSLSRPAKTVVSCTLALASLLGGVLAFIELREKFGNSYTEEVPLLYFGTNEFRNFLDRRLGESVKLNTELVMDSDPTSPEYILLESICDWQPEIDKKLPANVFVSGFPEFTPDYIEPKTHTHNETTDEYHFPKSAIDNVRCYDTLRIEFKDARHDRFSYGGTGVIRLPVTGEFVVERRLLSGPRAEYTLRER